MTPFFVDVLVGKERRVRPADVEEGRLTDWAQCSPLLGIKFGVAKLFDNRIFRQHNDTSWLKGVC